MERQTATYKLRYGLSALEHVRLVSVMKTTPFSLNIDECTSKASKKRILNILVSFFCETSCKCVCQLYASIEMVVVNANTVFEAVRDRFIHDEIPFTNLISVLSDSAAYMRGSLNGFHAKLRQIAPHVLDIDGDVCHHIHNSVQKFISILDVGGVHVKLLDDIYNDFDFSVDLRDDLKELCKLLGQSEKVPLERAGHRWMSVFDATARFLELANVLTLFYSSWLTVEEKNNFQPTMTQLLASKKKEVRLSILAILMKLKKKKLTPAGKERKRRILKKLILQSQETMALANVIAAILPLFKSFILTFEQREPMVHRLFDEIVQVFKNFLTCYLTHEYVNSCSDISKVCTSSENVLPLKRIFLGEGAQAVLHDMDVERAKSFRRKVLKAYKETAEYLKNKLPIQNKTLALLSTLDPELSGHSKQCTGLQDLFDALPTIVKKEQKNDFIMAASSLQTNTKFRDTISEKKLDLWWSKVFSHPQYYILGPVVKACLSIFTGPRVESSFSVMNNIINPKTNSMDVHTYESIHKIKYSLLNHDKTSVQLYQRKDPVYSPVDPSLCYYMQTAASRMKRSKTVKTTKKRIPKVSVHKTAESVKAQIEKNAITAGSKRKHPEDDHVHLSKKLHVSS